MTGSGTASGPGTAPSTPIKRIGLVRRKIGVSRDALFKQWETVHAPHIARVATPLRYTITFFDRHRDRSDPAFDGMAAVWLRDRGHYERTWGRNGDPELRADGFMDWLDRGRNPVLLTSEHVIVDSAVTREHEKFVFAARRRAGVPAGDLFHAWLHVHAPSIRAALEQSSGCRRYVISLADLGNDAPYDGVAEMWWESAETRRRFRPGADAFTVLLAAESTLTLVGHEIVVCLHRAAGCGIDTDARGTRNRRRPVAVRAQILIDHRAVVAQELVRIRLRECLPDWDEAPAPFTAATLRNAREP